MFISVNPFTETSIRSYQVKGYTNSLDKWDLDNYICKNKNTCWGPQLRFLEIQHSNHRWMYNFYNLFEVDINGFRVKTQKNIEKLYIR